VQECVSSANHDQRQLIIGVALTHVQSLINDEFGNFVVQQILERGVSGSHNHQSTSEGLKGIYDFIFSNVIHLCKQ